MLRILHVPNYYKPHIGGIEQTCHDIVESLNGLVVQKVICFSEDKHDKKELIDGVEVVKCGVWKKIMSQSISVSYKKELSKIINNFNPEIIIVHFPNPFVIHYLLKCIKKKSIKLIVWYHADIVKQKILGWFFKGQTRRILNKASQIICTSPLYSKASVSLKNFQDKITIIPSCINEERLAVSEEVRLKAEEIKRNNIGKIIVFAVGRHVPYKGLTYLIKASQHLNDNYAIFIAGQGPLTSELKKQAKHDSKIQFLGKVDDLTLNAWYLAMDMYAFPSITRNEAFGLSLAEAMYFHHPAITFTIPGSGVNYVSLNNETGIEVKNRDVKDFAKAIDKLGTDTSLRKKYGENAYQRVEKNFTFAKFKLNVVSFFKTKF